MDRVAKAQLTYELALKQSSKAVGDFERTQDGFANQVRITKGELTDAAVSLGEHLLPMAQKAIGVFRGLVDRFNSLSASTKESIVKWGLLVATIGPALIIVGKIALGISSLITLFSTLRTAVLATSGAFKALTLAMVKNPIGAVITLATSAAAAYFLLETNTKGATKAQREFNGVTESTEDAIKRLSKSVGDMGKDSLQLQIEEIQKLIYDIKGFEIPAGASPFAPAGLPLTKKQQDQLKQLNGLLTKLKAKQAQAKKEADELSKSLENLGDDTGKTGDDTNDLIKATEEYSMTLDPLISKIEEYATMSKKMWHDDGMLAGPMTAAEANYEKLFTMQDAWNDSVSSFGDIFAGSMESAMTSQENFFSAFIKNLKQAIGKQLAMLAALEITGFLLGGIGGGMLTKGLPKGAGDFLRGIIPMADGGVVMGPQMALIGEAGPEAVIPLDQLKNFGGAQQVEVVGKISGTDIFLSNRNTGTNRQRSV